MPIYEYACDACAHQFETIQKASEAPPAECPSCGKPALRKLLSAAAFRLKGGGWYETDFKKDNKKNVAGGEADKTPAQESASGGTSDGTNDSASKSPKESSTNPSAPSTTVSSERASSSGSSLSGSSSDGA